MHATIKFTGALEQILSGAVERGFAKTKTEALRMAVLELNNKYGLLEQAKLDELAVKKMQRIDKEIAEGKRKVFTEAQVRKKYPEFFK